MREVWWANAFVGPEAGGNATCVVIEDPASSPVERAEIARALRAPDTAFVTREPGERWAIRFFSPDEGEMAFCGQGLIAAHAVTRSLELSTSLGIVSTRTDPVVRDLCWFSVARDTVRLLGEAEAALPVPLVAPRKSVVIDTGRPRLYQRLDRPEDLAAITIEPDVVLRACSSLQIKGLCFFAPVADKSIALRVFTVSLGGREDASTGGAVLGLSALLPPGEWTVEQGHGRALRRGLLRLSNAPDDPSVAVGGRVEIVARGTLAQDRGAALGPEALRFLRGAAGAV